MAHQRSSTVRTVTIIVGALAVGLLVVIPIVALLSGGGPFGGDDPNQTPFATDADTVTVTIRDFVYTPDDLTINAGTTVIWVNEDSASHDATSRDETWATARLDEDESAEIAFNPGTFEYYCSFHPYMEAQITVR